MKKSLSSEIQGTLVGLLLTSKYCLHSYRARRWFPHYLIAPKWSQDMQIYPHLWHLPHLSLIKRSICLISFSSATFCGLTFERLIFQNTWCLKFEIDIFFKWTIVLPSYYPLPLPIFQYSADYRLSLLLFQLNHFSSRPWRSQQFPLNIPNNHSPQIKKSMIHNDDTRFIVQISKVTFFYFAERRWKSLFSSSTYSFCVSDQTWVNIVSNRRCWCKCA